MVATSIGLGEPQHDTLVPDDMLVERNPAVSAFDLARKGLIQGDQVVIGPPDPPYQAGIATARNSQTIHIVWHPALSLPMFQCPDCERNCYRLHWCGEQWTCRKCAGYTYSCLHRHRTIPRYARALWLRKRLGASLELFSPIAPRPRHWRRYWRLTAELREIERGIAIYLGVNINDVLERRDARRSRRSRSADPA